PNVCSGSTTADPCRTGLPTWPVWVPDQAPTLSSRSSMEIQKPGRKDRAALIYLGWAAHMMEDAAVPHHVANRTGVQHDLQDAYGDRTEYYFSTPAKEQLLIDNYMATDVTNIFGSVSQPKSRDAICQSLNLVDS